MAYPKFFRLCAVILGIIFWAELLLAFAGASAGKPVLAENVKLILDDFDYRPANTLDGKRGRYRRSPSSIEIALTGQTFYGEKGKSLELRYDKKESGWCGYYTLLARDDNFFDAARFRSLYFWVKGAKGGESFEVGLADRKWFRKDDSAKAGNVKDYLPSGVTQTWQKVVVPFTDFGDIDRKELASLVINFDTEGKGTVWIDDIIFSDEEAPSKPAGKAAPPVKVIDNFEDKEWNAIGSHRGTFQRAPSEIKIEILPSPQSKMLEIRYKKDRYGWCGIYSLLRRGGRYFDATDYRFLTFRVKGARGGENFEIGMADRNWDQREESFKAGKIEQYLPGGVKTFWREVKIPLFDFVDVDFAQTSSVALVFSQPGEGIIYLDDMKLTK